MMQSDYVFTIEGGCGGGIARLPYGDHDRAIRDEDRRVGGTLSDLFVTKCFDKKAMASSRFGTVRPIWWAPWVAALLDMIDLPVA
jgi:hypothetical protein